MHFSEDEEGRRVRPASSVPNRHPISRANERQLAMWCGAERNLKFGPRLACQAIVNAHQDRRLRWAVIPAGCVLGNSVNHIELHEDIQAAVSISLHGIAWKQALQWMCHACSTTKISTSGPEHGRRTTTSTITNWKCCHSTSTARPSGISATASIIRHISGGNSPGIVSATMRGT